MNAAPHDSLTDQDFERLRGLVRQHTGIALDDSKRPLVAARIGRRMRRLQLSSYSEYCGIVSEPEAPELDAFVNAITTNLTSFFREPAHFEHLAQTLVPRWRREKTHGRIRVWSAGCSSGEEPYCVAMVLGESLPGHWDWRVLATDLDSNMLGEARRGIYTADRTQAIGHERLARWFQKGTGSREGQVRVREALRRRIAFNRLNLNGAWPMKGRFDAIFCRNVAIYFDRPTQATLFNRFADLLVDGGVLYVGHSESLAHVCDRFRLVGATIYEVLA